jgi:hypothetical protein
MPWGDERVLVRSVAPSVLPAVHAVVPEQVPTIVVTANDTRSSFLMALLVVSVIRA